MYVEKRIFKENNICKIEGQKINWNEFISPENNINKPQCLSKCFHNYSIQIYAKEINKLKIKQ